MSYDISVTREAQRVRVTVKGDATPGQLHSLMQVLAVDSASWHCPAVLFDFSKLRSRFTPAEKAAVRDEAARHLVGMRSIVVAWPEQD